MTFSLALTIAGLCTISGIVGYATALKRVGKRESEMDHLCALLSAIAIADAETAARSLEGQ